VSPLRYEYPLDQYIHALKFQSDRRMGRALGLVLAEQVKATGAAAAVDTLVPVPLHRKRLLQRGFNQAYEIAHPVASTAERSLLTAGIVRYLPTQPQSLVGARERAANVGEAFAVRRRLDGLRVAIIDDVITTGATVNSLARSLRRSGAVEVQVWAVARAAPCTTLETNSPA
jgi:ComF family protein